MPIALVTGWAVHREQDPQAAEDGRTESIDGIGKGGPVSEDGQLALTRIRPQLQSASLVRSAILSSLRHTLASRVDFPDLLASPTVAVGYGLPRLSPLTAGPARKGVETVKEDGGYFARPADGRETALVRPGPAPA
jgi:hypothetical protein